MPEHADVALRLLAGAAHAREEDPWGASLSDECLAWLDRMQIDSLLLLGQRPLPSRQRFYDAYWRAQRAALLAVVRALEAEGVEPLVVKGAEFLERYYGGHALNVMTDADVLVEPHDVEAARTVLRDLGFRQAHLVHGPRLVDLEDEVIQAAEAGHYELAAFRRLDPVELDPIADATLDLYPRGPIWRTGDGCVALVSVDVHHGLATNLPASLFLSGARPSALGAGRALGASDLLWFTVSRFYTEVANGKRTLRDFAYVIPLLVRDAVDWDVVLAAHTEHALGPALHYHLAFLDRLLAGAVPEDVLRETRPRGYRRTRDWGWQLAQLFDLAEPFPLEIPDLTTVP